MTEIEFVSPDVGWASTTWGVARTADGGHLWEAANPRPLKTSRTICSGSPSASALAAAGARNAWFAWYCLRSRGPRSASVAVWRTNDGGRSWSGLRVYLRPSAGRPTALKLNFVSRTVGWLEAVSGCPCRGRTVPGVVELLQTRDSGSGWKALDPPPRGLAVLGFSSPRHGYGYTAEDLLGDARLRRFPLVTADGGNSWHAVPVTAPAGARGPYADPGIAGLSPGARVAVPVAERPVGGRDSRTWFTTYVSDDGGRRWHHTEVLDHPSWEGWSYYYRNASDGWVSDSQGLRRTTDGGRSWRVANRHVGVGQGFDFVTAKVGYMLNTPVGLGSSGLLRTDDGGRSWRSVHAVLYGSRSFRDRRSALRAASAERRKVIEKWKDLKGGWRP